MCQQRTPPDREAVPEVARQEVPHPAFDPPSGLGALPTNQWWSSLLSPHPEALWAQPLTVTWTAEGAALSVARPRAVSKTIFAGQTSPLVLMIPGATPKLSSYGDFHVVAALKGTSSSGEVTVAQGSPATWVKILGGGLSLQLPDRATLTSSKGKAVTGSKWTDDEVRIAVPDGSAWTIVVPKNVTWNRDGIRLRVDVANGETVGIVARPTDATSKWNALARNAGRHPVTGTLAAWRRETGWVTQRLTWVGDPGLVTLMPHQTTDKTKPVGSFPSPRGAMPVVAASRIMWEAPLPGMLFGVPQLPDEVKTAVAKDLAADKQPVVPAGAYFGPKAIGRLATQTDLARMADPAQAQPLVDRLGKELENVLTRTKAGDDRWAGYDEKWGGFMTMPPQFGSDNYNDHNFQNGYLLQAAATLAEAGDPRAVTLKPMLDLIVADIGVLECHAGFPPFRVMNAYEGNSYASGFAPFIDGNNQESSSEAVHAWWSMARWALATGQTSLADQAMALYATEAHTARWYWLGEMSRRQAGYDHQTAGIVWGGKIDFATWFDARPVSAVGIQLLPFTFGSLYRSNADAAKKRFDEGSKDSGDHWSDLLGLDLALADPEKAGQVLATASAIEEGNSRAFANAWIGLLKDVGPPDNTVVSDPPLGLGFRTSGGRITLAAVNPTGTEASVVFRQNGRVLATVVVPPRSSVSQRL
jgi:endo-1,3(4)-beta-glucanase